MPKLSSFFFYPEAPFFLHPETHFFFLSRIDLFYSLLLENGLLYTPEYKLKNRAGIFKSDFCFGWMDIYVDLSIGLGEKEESFGISILF